MMQLRYETLGPDSDDFIVVNKGFGFRTHRVSDGQFGLVEFLSEKLGHTLFVVHRLDKDTSGLMLFARTKTAAQKLSALFEEHRVQKTYLFLTDRPSSSTQFSTKSYIEKVDNQFRQNDAQPANAETHFEFVEKLGKHFLWRAKPITGKPHQIRLHAEKEKIPILGDIEHGGSSFFRLALHSDQLQFEYLGESYDLKSDRSELFQKPAENEYAFLLQACFEKRKNLYEIPPTESFRLLHTESERIRADVFAERLWIYDYTDQGLNESEKDSLAQFAKAQNLQLTLRHMLDRGTGVGGLEKKTLESATSTEQWTAEEEGVNYVLKSNSGFSPGLFLDQRENRLWVRKNAAARNVLNLFCYTAGFSVTAALGQAQQVTSVDVSSKFLNWSKENFLANGLHPDQHEFFTQDGLLFLKGSLKRKRTWDLIICDPPTFGRSKDSVWKLERDLPELAELMLQCLSPKGQILFTCNYEKMNRDEVVALFTKKIKAKVKIERLPQLSLDYEHTDDLKNLMKGLLLRRAQTRL